MIEIPVMNFQSKLSDKVLSAYLNTGLGTQFQAKRGDNGVSLRLYDVIGSQETNAKTFAAALGDADGAPLTLHLSSPGGSVFDGLAMYNTLKNYPGDTTVQVDGVCASIATIIALGADRVTTAENSLWMIHNAFVGTVGNAKGLRASADVLDKIDANLMAIYAAKTGSSPDKWASIMAEETWFTSDSAIEAGLVDAMTPAVEGHAQNQLAETIFKAAFDPEPEQPEDVSDAVALAKLRVRRALVAALTGQT